MQAISDQDAVPLSLSLSTVVFFTCWPQSTTRPYYAQRHELGMNVLSRLAVGHSGHGSEATHTDHEQPVKEQTTVLHMEMS